MKLLKIQFVKNMGSFILFMFFITSGNAATFYVSSDGSDSNPGTQSQPWQSISKVNGLQPGDILLLFPGTYTGLTTITASGAPESPIVIASADTNSYAVLSGGGSPGDANKLVFILNNVSWMNFERLEIRDGWKHAIRLNHASFISLRKCNIYGSTIMIDMINTSHHLLVEACYWEQDSRVWSTWLWEDIHHGAQIFCNGSLIDGDAGNGALVIRNNHFKYSFNTIRVTSLFANAEVYGNYFEYIRDNAVEFEAGIWNWHIYHNIFKQVLYVCSIDRGEGGYVYFYGNIGYYDPDDVAPKGQYTTSPWGILKFISGDYTKLTDPFYDFHNTWVYRKLTDTNRFNRHVTHRNNIGIFTKGYNVGDVMFTADPTNTFDYDLTWPLGWSSGITNYNQEQHGIVADPLLVNNSPNDYGDYHLQAGSPAKDAGTIIAGFTQSYDGSAPDMGAYEEDELVEGPPYYTRVPSGGLDYPENPRITRHRVNGSELRIYWSWDIQPSSISTGAVHLKADGADVKVNSAVMGADDKEIIISTETSLENKALELTFDPLPTGSNGLTATHWASTIGSIPSSGSSASVTENNLICVDIPEVYQLHQNYPNPFNPLTRIHYDMAKAGHVKLIIYDMMGRIVSTLVDDYMDAGSYVFEWGAVDTNGRKLPSNIYICRMQTDSYVGTVKMLFMR